MRYRPDIYGAIRQQSFVAASNSTALVALPAVANHINVIHWIAASYSSAPAAVTGLELQFGGVQKYVVEKELAGSDFLAFPNGMHNGVAGESVNVILPPGGGGRVGRLSVGFSVPRFAPDEHSALTIENDSPVATVRARVSLAALATQGRYIDFIHCSVSGATATFARVGVFSGSTPLWQVEMFPIGIFTFNNINLTTPVNTAITVDVEAPGVGSKVAISVGHRSVVSDPNARDGRHQVGTNRTAGTSTGTAGVETRSVINYFHTSFDDSYAGAPTQITINETGDSSTLLLSLDETVGKPFSMNFPVPIVSARGVAHALTQTGDSAGTESHSVGFQ